jgi:hypothetical protein
MQIAGITPQQMVRALILGWAVFGWLTKNRLGYLCWLYPRSVAGAGDPERRMC